MSRAKTYVARPVEVQAVQWAGRLGDLPVSWTGTGAFSPDEEDPTELVVTTLEGPSNARVGDYVVRGTAGEFYPVRRPIFEGKYEVVR